MLEEQKKAISETGRLAEGRPEGPIEGYLAEHPPMMPHVFRVWSPCGCCWTWMSPGVSVLTQCDAPNHDFSWPEATAALDALRAAEEGEKGGESEPKLAIVPVSKT